MILDEIEKEGQNIRKNYQRRLPSNPVKDYYFIHRNTPDTESVLVEYGFLDSPKDDVNQLKNNYKNYAEAVVRAIAKYKNIPIIMVTARSQENDKLIGEETGADEYITKPFEFSDVLEVIHKYTN